MESQDKEKEYEHNIWEIYRREWATASEEKRVELNKRMFRWQGLMKSGWTASQAYYKVMEEPQETPLSYPFWTKMRKALVIIPVLALAAAIVYGIVITGEINPLKTELESVQTVLASTQAELSSTKQTLASTQAEFTSTQAELSSLEQTLTSAQAELSSLEQTLTSAQAELSSTEQTLASTQAELTSTQLDLNSTEVELSSTKQTLASTQSELTTTKQTLASTQQQLAVAQETLGGLGITVSTSKDRYGLIDNLAATNPTWSQLETFLSQDQTEKHPYTEDVYDCTEFSRDVHNNAEAAGIRAAVVHVDFKNEDIGHALNAFLTSNYGLVYVDCTEMDTIARIKAGKEYRAVKLYRITGINVRNDYWWDTLHSYYYFSSSTWGHSVTSSIIIYW